MISLEGFPKQAQRKPTKDDFNSPEYLKGFLSNDRQDAGEHFWHTHAFLDAHTFRM